jgi:hypothetical protein
MNSEILSEVAAAYWQEDRRQLSEALKLIVVVKNTDRKVIGLLPAYKRFPAAFVKIYPPDGVAKFNAEYKGLLVANQLEQCDGIRSSMPIGVDMDRRAIFVHRRDYLDTDTAWKRFFVQSLPIDWRAVGSWLRRFHDSSITRDCNHDFLARVERQIGARLDRLRSEISAEQGERIMRIVDQAKASIMTQRYEWVSSHGDFGLANIRCFENTIEIIDFERFTSAPREFDILYCLVRLEKSNCFPQRREVFERIRSQFCAGYGMTPSISPMYRLLVVYSMLELVYGYYRHRKSRSWRRADQWIAFYLKWHSVRRLNHWLDEFGT